MHFEAFPDRFRNAGRDGRVDYGGSLENCWRRKSPVGSNPTPSARYIVILLREILFLHVFYNPPDPP